VHQVLSPHYELTFHGSSHGFRPGRSCHTAIAEAQSHPEEGYEWVIDMDLERFFDRVHHQRLLARLEQRAAQIPAPFGGCRQERSRRRIRDKIRELTPRSWGQSLSDCIKGLNRYLLGWVGFFFPCSDAEERTMHSLDAHIRRRLRAIVLRHCKRKRHIVHRLIRLGANQRAAWTDVYKDHRSLWKLTACFSVQRTLGIRYFVEHGLVSVEARWQKLRAQHAVAPVQLALALG